MFSTVSTVTGDHMTYNNKTAPTPSKKKKDSEPATLPNLWHLGSGSDASSETQGESVRSEKRQDKSYQVRAKEPLDTNCTLTELFPKIQPDAGSWLGTKNALYYCAQSANSCSHPELFSWVCTMSRHTCPVRSPSLSVQGKLLFSTFLTRNEGTMSRKNVWDAISRSNSIWPKNILFLTDHNVS